MKLGHLREDHIVKKLTRSLQRDERVIIGAGDDCAVVRFGRNLQLLKSDCVIEGIHFLSDTDARWVGWKAICRAISDIAAMGGEPSDALVTVALPKELDLSWAERFYSGLRKAAGAYAVNIVGGETARSPGPIFVSVSLTGRLRNNKFVTRTGGKIGDLLYVTGLLGGSIKGKHLRFHPRLKEATWLVDHFSIHAMMDLSDGLAADLPRMADASRTGFELSYDRLPLTRGSDVKGALQDGEDYELLFAVSPRIRRKLEANWKRAFPRLQLTEIGRLMGRGEGEMEPGGYDHFKTDDE